MNILVLCADNFTIKNDNGINIAVLINKKFNITKETPNIYYVGLDINIKEFLTKRIIKDDIYNFSFFNFLIFLI